ncbi:MAG: pilus assembly protein TadG-related protein [Alphaproteobacteria bacterium]|nr:pilus assembly protein TadG-related protein [Alphaproteobacteria bacterium]MDX5368224.1 pilus assembly protein TadG-related protein [Alphaproteobacteria bacterium]MDX5463033.1 pilus assembly protein TadG-related protein [Alphaproteobacteria bacterium]
MPSVRAFFRDRGAAVAIIFALSLVPVAGVAGIAVDYATARSAQRYLQGAVDAAALAAAASLGGPPGQLKKVAEDAFSTNMSAFPYGGEIGKPRVEVLSDRIEVSASVDVPTSLSGILGISQMNVVADAVASTASGQPLEIAFVIDITQSMGWNGSYDTARAEIESLLTELQSRMASGENVVATVVPFSDRVNVGPSRGASWISGGAPSDWQGCVEPRVEAETGFPYMESDASPATLGFAATKNDFGIYREHNVPGAFGLPIACQHEIIGPTTSAADIHTEMDTVIRAGTGRMDQGIAWAWRVLSPKWRGQWGRSGYPANYGDARKIMVFLGDGMSAAYHYEMGGSNGNPPPGEDFIGNTPSFLALEHIKEMCGRMKADGIEIFVLYLNGIPRSEPYLKACASDPDTMFSVSNTGALKQSFKDLGDALVAQGSVRLIR